MSAMFRVAYSALSPGGRRGRLSVLIFHRVLPQQDPLFPHEMHAARFDAVCSWLRVWFNVLPLTSAVQRLQDRTLPPRAMAITFDDGYADNHDIAMPILKRHGLTASFFIATGFCDGGRMWNDTLIEAVRGSPLSELRADDLLPELTTPLSMQSVAYKQVAIERLIGAAKYLEPALRQRTVDAIATRCRGVMASSLMMSRRQVQQLHVHGMEVGAHTVNHPILARLSASAARDEIANSKAALEDWTDAPVHTFAYPNGRPGDDYSPENVEIVRQLGFTAAVSTARGIARPSSDPLQIPRFTPWDRTRARFGLRLLTQLAAR